MNQVAEHFAEVAVHAEERRSDEALVELLNQTQALCEQASRHAASAETQRLLAQVQTALATWRDVWPRLGVQREFRLAVAREARSWAKQFADIT